MDKIQIIILAAGLGKRMKNKEIPKVLAPLEGKPLIRYLLEAVDESGVCEKPVIVVGQKADMVKEALGPNYTYVFQTEQLGTGHAVMSAREELEGKVKNIMVLNGDHPLVTAETIKKLAQGHLAQEKVLTLGVVKTPDFDDWRQSFYDFGRVVRNGDGKLSRIVEKKDASPEQLEIKEVNPNYFCFKADWLWSNLDKLKNDNAQGEYYLTDLLGIACQQDQEIATVEIELKSGLGVNNEEQLELISQLV